MQDCDAPERFEPHVLLCDFRLCSAASVYWLAVLPYSDHVATYRLTLQLLHRTPGMVQSQCALPRAEPHFAKEGHTFLSHVSRVNCHASCDALGGLAPTPIVVLNNNVGRYVCTSEPHSFMATATHFTSCSTVDSWLTACSWSRATTV
ncbi:hypothetical protein TGGT1_410480 [Toxoplasma gondii GT1]|uniref:Uncharacterized protein n=1 Tax=Toxoplasma gondii (strain ATCC 50853 / GT1) TaxID=507601 RepID=S7VYD5_TOXGG|nr:hypothetical protein TGGT1_410480 [Toxoplasma gondii GT1]